MTIPIYSQYGSIDCKDCGKAMFDAPRSCIRCGGALCVGCGTFCTSCLDLVCPECLGENDCKLCERIEEFGRFCEIGDE